MPMKLADLNKALNDDGLGYECGWSLDESSGVYWGALKYGAMHDDSWGKVEMTFHIEIDPRKPLGPQVEEIKAIRVRFEAYAKEMVGHAILVGASLRKWGRR